jgi:hypothetical protein
MHSEKKYIHHAVNAYQPCFLVRTSRYHGRARQNVRSAQIRLHIPSCAPRKRMPHAAWANQAAGLAIQLLKYSPDVWRSRRPGIPELMLPNPLDILASELHASPFPNP